MSAESPHPTVDGSVGLELSNMVVKLLSEYTGRGATKARAYYHDDLVTVVVQDLLTTGERTLVRDGQPALVLDLRRAFQDSMAVALTAGVERITGRTVTAFLSANHIDPDVAVESFVLAR
jgi:uncharacterized protein YbcI